jgi:KTSC domain
MNRALPLALALLLPGPLAAEEVCVKYHKCVPLNQFQCTDLTRSSFVERVCYAESKRYMIIKLQGTYYHYCQIGPATVAELLAAPSIGRYYNANIKSAATNRAFDCRDHPIPSF